MDRRRFCVAAAAASAGVIARPLFADEAYPSHAVTIINPFPPGGANDVVTRPLASALEPILNQAVVIETKAGAAGQVGAQFAAAAKPDGYTLLSHNTALAGFAAVDRLFGRAPKFTNDSFIPIARIVADPCVLLVNDQQPYKTLQDFVDDAKKRPNQIIFSSGGLYGAIHLPMALLAKAAGGLQLRHLPTNGGGPALTALLGNNVQCSVAAVSASRSQMKAGKVRPLALFGAKRAKALPDVPTLKDLGYDVEYYLWVGIFAPAHTPDTALARLRAAIGKAVHTQGYEQALDNLGIELGYLDAPEFAKFWSEDAKRVELAVDSIGRVQGRTRRALWIADTSLPERRLPPACWR